MQRASHFKFLPKSPAFCGMCFAWAGALICASSNSIATFLVQTGAGNPVHGTWNAITCSYLLSPGPTGSTGSTGSDVNPCCPKERGRKNRPLMN